MGSANENTSYTSLKGGVFDRQYDPLRLLPTLTSITADLLASGFNLLISNLIYDNCNCIAYQLCVEYQSDHF
jgi:hypothetical protein